MRYIIEYFKIVFPKFTRQKIILNKHSYFEIKANLKFKKH